VWISVDNQKLSFTSFLGKLWLVGGLEDSTTIHLQIFDVEECVWTVGPNLPSIFTGDFVCRGHNGKLYALDILSGKAVAYDMTANQWTTVNERPFEIDCFVGEPVGEHECYVREPRVCSWLELP